MIEITALRLLAHAEREARAGKPSLFNAILAWSRPRVIEVRHILTEKGVPPTAPPGPEGAQKIQ